MSGKHVYILNILYEKKDYIRLMSSVQGLDI